MSVVPAIRLVPSRSRALARALWLVHALAVALVALGAEDAASMCLFAGALAVHLAWSLRWLARVSRGLLALSLDGQGRCRLQWQDGRSEAASLCGAPFLTPWLVCLRLRAAGSGTRVTLLVSDEDPDALRRLRARLAWQRRTARDSEPAALPPRQP
jgi:hypothetical protein